MPILQDALGAYSIIKIGGNYYLCNDVSRGEKMVVEPVHLIQGTPKTRVLKIDQITQRITVNLPILIGRGSTLDGRQLLIDNLIKALDPDNASLPIIESASINLADDGASVSVTLLTDGNPIYGDYYEVLPNIQGTGTPSDRLDPLLTPGGTRQASKYDIAVNLAGFYAYVRSGSINVQTSTLQALMYQGVPPTGRTDFVPNPNPLNWGTQYPYIGVANLTITGSGEALVILKDRNNDGRYTSTPGMSMFNPDNEVVNVTQNSLENTVTNQSPGFVRTTPGNFTIMIANDHAELGPRRWNDMFLNPLTNASVVDLSRSIVSEAGWSVTPQWMTNKFSFTCYVA